MEKTTYTINGKLISYEIDENGYTIYLDEHPWISQHDTCIPYSDLGYEGSCLKQIEDICNSITQEPEQEPEPEPQPTPEPTEEEILQAEMLLNQMQIIATQQEQDEVLAGILLNQMEV